MPRVIHFYNLPEDSIRILLDDYMRNLLFNEIIKSTKTIKNLAEFIGENTDKSLNKETVRDYKIAKYFIPLWLLKFLVKNTTLKSREIEKHIIAFRGPRGDAVYSPRFPWREDKRIIRVVFRLIGDGHAGGDICKGRVPIYVNTCSKLIEQFISDLQFFGNTRIRRYEDRRRSRKMIVKIEFPKVIGYILKHLYNIDFRGKYARLSKEIFSLPKKLLFEGIKAFADDEGSVKGTQINIYSANKKLLEDFVRIFRTRLPEFKTVTDVRICAIKGEFISYYFSILSKDFDKYRKLIRFNHPVKQRKLLFQLKCKNKIKNNRYDYTTKKMILTSLKKRVKTAYEIAEDVTVHHRTVNKHLNGYLDKGRYFKGLVEMGFIKAIQKRNNEMLFSITEKGKLFNFNNISKPYLLVVKDEN